MIVYVDVLITVNLAVNYFLLLGTSRLLRVSVRTWRMLLSALLGAMSSLYIFLPESTAVAELAFKIILCLIMSAVGFGIKSVKVFLKNSLAFFGVTCAYAGIMVAVWRIFRPHNMLVSNSVVYFNISPLALVAFSVAVYSGFVLVNRIFARSAAYAGECEITVDLCDGHLALNAILDTGNSITDVFGKSEIIIADSVSVEKLIKPIKGTVEADTRFRIVPCATVSGEDMLEGYRCDKALVKKDGKAVFLDKPIIAASKSALNDGYNAIVNPRILD